MNYAPAIPGGTGFSQIVSNNNADIHEGARRPGSSAIGHWAFAYPKPRHLAVFQRLTFAGVAFRDLLRGNSGGKFDEQRFLRREAFLARTLAAVVAVRVHDPGLGVVGEVGQQAFLEDAPLQLGFQHREA